ncbi:hypothetical protein WJX72_011396 [[Myrmecia] bisecta]|uniref:Glucose-6-phosphate 1-dehydrogenase n=1 Tax=[Myrmecia] bisecta TaxID=41462 RepID=A0AAW1PXW2_9CHLO
MFDGGRAGSQRRSGQEKDISCPIHLVSSRLLAKRGGDHRGPYDSHEGFQQLQTAIQKWEDSHQAHPHGRLFYLALPPSVYPEVCKGLHDNCPAAPGAEGGFTRLVVEKPFGFDLDSSEVLAGKLGALYPEEQLYRIDHYLGKEMMQNMLTLRFANTFFSPCWNNTCVANVQISFKEPFGTEGRGGYFDQFGIIRDVIQNHLMQVMALVAMEKPVSLSADDIRDEKVKLLRCVHPVSASEAVLGQYTASGDQPGYLDDPTVPTGSRTPTFAATVLHIQNDRWAGVPFVLKAGKALNERKAEIRLQFKPPGVALHAQKADELRNELVVRLQPDEAIYMKVVVKKPGLQMDTVISELDLSYKQRYSDTYIPEAYERLILDAVHGDQQHFVRRDELRAAWAVFTPLLHAIDSGAISPLPYPAGSRGPGPADELIAKAGFVKNAAYSWKAG